MFAWQETDHLVLDIDGHLWQRYRRGLHWLGPIEDAGVPGHLEREYDELLDLWRDAARDDERAQVLDDYFSDRLRRS